MRKAQLSFTGTWPNHVKNVQHIGSKKIYGPNIKVNNKQGPLLIVVVVLFREHYTPFQETSLKCIPRSRSGVPKWEIPIEVFWQGTQPTPTGRLVKHPFSLKSEWHKRTQDAIELCHFIKLQMEEWNG